MPLASNYFRRGLRSAQPAATAVNIGALYFVTDEAVTERSNGTAWETYSDAGSAAQRYTVGISIDGGGSAITTGVKAPGRSIPVSGTIVSCRMLADQSGSAVVDIWKDTYANYPPVVGDSITASAKPTISAAVKSEDTTLTGWTTSVTAGDVLRFNVDSAATITKLTLELVIEP